MTSRRQLRRDAVVIAGLLGAVTALVAVAVHVIGGSPIRNQLGFPFAGLDPEPVTAFTIFVHNAILLGLVLVAAAVVRFRGWPWRSRSGLRAAVWTLVVAAVDTFLALNAALNVLIVGAALGAYERRMVLAVLPHGPLELAAASLALAAYTRARRDRISESELADTAIEVVALLAGAAWLETYVTL